MNFISRINKLAKPKERRSPYFDRKLSIEDMRRLSKEVPLSIADDLGAGIDSEQYHPKEDGSLFPTSWTYEMRCVENHAPSMAWIRSKAKTLPCLSEEEAPLLCNLVKVVAWAAHESISRMSL